jgi:trehalose 6-phosphate synthase/phosphatase
VAVPSRTSVPTYHNLKKEVDELVGYINGKHSTLGWTPIQYYYRSFDFNRLVTLYSLSDVALLTPLRDGMNLVAKEYIASKKDGKGVLIFSEMAGATSELGEALIVNPNNREEIAAKLKQALEMSVAEQKERFSLMQERISRYTIFTWAEDFIQRLSLCKSEQAQIKTRHVSDENRKKILDSYKRAGRRLIILDYDGTLVPFQKDPSQAKPGKEIFKTLNKLIRDNKNELVIVSGRDKETLDKWFGHLNINLSAEHGLWIKNRKDDWHMLEHIGNEWKEVIRPIMRLFVDRTPGSFIEEKSHSLVWHYRKADLGMGTLRARELKTELLHLTANLNLHVMTGNMVLEVKRSEINKGRAVYYWSSEGSWEFIFAVGDDFTDEYIFEELPGKAFKIKVGIGMTKADYFLRDQAEVLELLREMSEQN